MTVQELEALMHTLDGAQEVRVAMPGIGDVALERVDIEDDEDGEFPLLIPEGAD